MYPLFSNLPEPAVEAPVDGYDVPTPAPNDLVERRHSRLYHPARQDVGVDNGRTTLRQESSHSRLPAGDISRETNQKHGENRVSSDMAAEALQGRNRPEGKSTYVMMGEVTKLTAGAVAAGAAWPGTNVRRRIGWRNRTVGTARARRAARGQQREGTANRSPRVSRDERGL